MSRLIASFLALLTMFSIIAPDAKSSEVQDLAVPVGIGDLEEPILGRPRCTSRSTTTSTISDTSASTISVMTPQARRHRTAADP